MRRTESRTAPGLAFAVALLFAAGPTFAVDEVTGYDPDYDYAGQGDDWYGRAGRPDPRQDYPRPLLELVLSGEDFCQGYERVFDPFGYGPPLFRTQARHSMYAFRFSPADAGWPCLIGYVAPTCSDGNPCTADSFDLAAASCVNTSLPDGFPCADATFCNGQETCMAGGCVAGSIPSCDDSNGCTVDFCESTADQCVNLPTPLASEVQDLQAILAGPGSTVARLLWAAPPMSATYNLYLGTEGGNGAFNCYLSEVRGEEAEDLGEVPLLGTARLYLVTAANCAGESPLGYDSAGQERRNFRPCR